MMDRREFFLGTAATAVCLALPSLVRGSAQLRKVDGTVMTLVQVGDSVYEWDSATFLGHELPGTFVRDDSASGGWTHLC